jgi:predicted  nucleic acid-binding Zn-ribbon protein
VILEQSLTTTQEQLSQKVGDIVRLEQVQRKLNTELKTLKERAASYEDEIASQKETIGSINFFHSVLFLAWNDIFG